MRGVHKWMDMCKTAGQRKTREPGRAMQAKTNLTINPQRLWDSLMETAQFGGTPKGGIKRLTVSDEDKRVRDWFKAECEKLGMTVEVDEVGNMFATRPGRRKDLLPISAVELSVQVFCVCVHSCTIACSFRCAALLRKSC